MDGEQVRVCRSVLPALNPGAGGISVERIAPASNPHTLRIAYRVMEQGRARERYVLCRFAASGLSGRKAELLGVATEEGPITGASLYLLRRFYLDTPDGVAGDPGRSAAEAPEVPAAVAYTLQQLLAGAPRTAITALLAAAYALVFGLVGRINLAFGELTAVGAAAAVAGIALAGALPPAAGLLAGALAAGFAAGLHGLVAGRLAFAAVPAGAGQASLIATVGLSLALMEYLRLVQSPVAVWIPPIWSGSVPLLRAPDGFVAGATPVSLITAAVGLAAALALVLVMRRSAFGRSWRAAADDAGAAALCGVDAGALLSRTLLLSGALAGLAGFLVVVQFGGLGFAGGFQFGLKALVAAILGGVGSVPGALLGGLGVGLFETLWQAFLPIEGRDIALYCALVAVLMFRPGGLFGAPERGPRPV